MAMKLFDLYNLLMPQRKNHVQFESTLALDVYTGKIPFIQDIEKIDIDDVYIPIGDIVIRDKTYHGAIFGVEPADFTNYHRLAAIWLCDTFHDVILLSYDEIAKLIIVEQAKPKALILKDIVKRIVELYTTNNFDRDALVDVLELVIQGIKQPIFVTKTIFARKKSQKKTQNRYYNV